MRKEHVAAGAPRDTPPGFPRGVGGKGEGEPPAGGTRRRSAERGLYQLLIELPRPRRLRIGALGRCSLPAGYYVYTGPAQGGLAGRVGRHLRGGGKRHWHIDYLLAAATVRCAITLPGGRVGECAWHARARTLMADVAGAREPVRGFGASDCRCTSHLLYAPRWPLGALLTLLPGG
ncbi:MAG: GIY-YIG nuclease family protein [Candidatus Tectomicrobia bacterium]|nr:GIY-YIG nuclease family protein [Candidatus Tectomicrobia bacterium]